MLRNDVKVRLNKIAQYKNRKFDKFGRLMMLDVDQLNKVDWSLKD